MRSASAVFAGLMLIAGAMRADAQSCERSITGWRVIVAETWHTGSAQWEPNRSTGSALERALGDVVRVRAEYTHQHGGADLRTAGIGAVVLPELPLRPCIALSVLGSRASMQGPGDHYRSIAVPLTVGRGMDVDLGGAAVHAYAAALAVYSASDARLFGFDIGRNGIAAGGTAGVNVSAGRWSLGFVTRLLRTDDDTGPTALGTNTIGISTAVRF